MHSRSDLSRPSPKRSLSCAGLDDLDELFHNSDNVRPPPNRKRHQSLNNDNNFCATNFVVPSSPSRHDNLPPPASYPGALRRPELSLLHENPSSGGDFRVVPSSSFEYRYPQASAQHLQAIDQHRNPHSDGQDNNYDDEQRCDYNDELNDADANYSGAHEYKSSSHYFVPNLTPQEPQDVLGAKRLDHSMFLPPSHRVSSSECSPREEYLVQAFGPSGFKLQGASVSSNDELDESLSDDSSNNDRDHNSSNQDMGIADADTELKMSFNELEADIRGAMHHNLHHQQHSTRLPELAGLSHSSFASPSHGPFGQSRSPTLLRNNQDTHRVAVFNQSQDSRPHLLLNQKEGGYFPGEQYLQSPSRASSLGKTPQSKGRSRVQTPTKWLRDEDERLRVAVARFGGKNWKMIAETLGNGRTDVQCLHRWNKVLKPGLIKGPWTPEEDRVLTSLITRYGVGKIRWCDLALHLPGRIGKQCRERWCNHLDSRIRKGQWTPEEDDMVFRWQQKLGNKWSEIAKLLPGRTENAVKNRFNSAARRKWLMTQANKSSSSPLTQTVPGTPTQACQGQLQQQQHSLLQPSSTHQEGSLYTVSTSSYGGEKVSPLPSTEALLDYQSYKIISPHERQNNFIQHFSSLETPVTSALLPSGLDGPRSFRPALSLGGEQLFQQQDHDKIAGSAKNESMPLTTPSTFVPPPLNALFPPSTTNTGTGGDRTLHHSANGPNGASEASVVAVFPFPTHLSTQVHHSPVNDGMSDKPTSSDLTIDKNVDLPLLPLKELKDERDDLSLRATSDVPATATATDPSVPMDDENMNSFLDSVALELDDIME